LLTKVSAEVSLGEGNAATAPRRIEEAITLARKDLNDIGRRFIEADAEGLKEVMFRTNTYLNERFVTSTGARAGIAEWGNIKVGTVPSSIITRQRFLNRQANDTLSEIVNGKKVSFADYIEAKLAEGQDIFGTTRDIWNDTQFFKMIRNANEWSQTFKNAFPKDIEAYVRAVIKERNIPNTAVAPAPMAKSDFNASCLTNGSALI